jgi:cytochrome P450
MENLTTSDDPLSPEWSDEHFDHLDPQFGRHFNGTLDQMRLRCPVAHSDRHGGFWVVTRYEDVLAVLQDWRTFSNASRVAIPDPPFPPLPLNEMDPPIHGVFKRLVNRYLTPAAVGPYEKPTRQIVTSLIDQFIETGSCEFMEAFAEQLPRQSFFELVFHAPRDEIEQLNHMTRIVAGSPETPGIQEAYVALMAWINGFVDARLEAPPTGDIVDAIITADIDGRPITREEISGLIMLLMFGGFETTASALGQIMIHFGRDPSIPGLLRNKPALVPTAVEEFLRVDAPVTAMARTVTRDTVLGGQQLRPGDKVLFHLSSANRDGDQFRTPAAFDPNRKINRHLAFGAGPHRCVGSNLARLNLRVAVEEITARLDDIRLEDGRGPIEYRSAFNRSPVAVPITFAPGRRRAEAPVG